MDDPKAQSAAPATDATRRAGRGGLALSAAKLYFLVLGFAQQIVLGSLLGADGYGALRGAMSPASITYNPLIAAGVQGMSRAVSRVPEAERAATVRRGLLLHFVLAFVVGGSFWLAAPALGNVLHSEYLVPPFRVLAIVVLFYGIYAPFVGVLNGLRRFGQQAALDVLSATLRTVALFAGAYWLLSEGALRAVEGACWGFAGVSLVMVFVSVGLVGIGRAGATRLGVGEHLWFIVPVIVAQAVLNLLLQVDVNTLRGFASRAATSAGLSSDAANTLVGAYSAGQLFGFLPYQLLIGLTFILFPLLASAQAKNDRKAVEQYVLEGTRLATVVMGLVVSVSAGLSESLLRLAFPPRFAEVGTASMQLLTLGLGAFALFGVFTTVLNGLGRQWQSLSVTALATALVFGLNWLLVKDTAFGPELLLATARATSIGMVCAALGAAVLVKLSAGAVIRPSVLVRVGLALALTVLAARQLPTLGKVATVGASLGVASCYVVLLVLLRELGTRDARRVRAIFGGK